MKVSHKKNLKTVVATKRTSSRRAGARKQKVVSYAEAPSDSDTEANSSSSEEEEDVFPGKTATSRALKNKTNKVSTKKKKKPPANKKTKASVKQPPSPPPPVELPPGFHETVMNKSVTSVARDKSLSPSPPKDWRVWGAMDY